MQPSLATRPLRRYHAVPAHMGRTSARPFPRVLEPHDSGGEV